MKTKMEHISKIISDNNLGLIYNYEEEKENGLLLPFVIDIMKRIDHVGLDFCITTDTSHRCGIMYDEKLIFMSYGTFDRLCKLADLIVRSGIITGKKQDIKYYDLHLIDNPYIGFNDSKKNEYSCEIESNLFLFLTQNLLSFVVYHEIGHFIKKHGSRKTKNNLDNIFDDIIGHKNINKKNRKKLIASHARELVADNFALNFLVKDINFHLMGTHYDSFLKQFKGKNGDAFLSILLITCYFKLSDGLNPHEHFSSSHPSTAARVRFLYSCYLETLNDDDDQINSFLFLVKKILSLVDVMFSYIGNNSKSTWIEDTSSTEMTEWFNDIHNEYKKWNG